MIVQHKTHKIVKRLQVPQEYKLVLKLPTI